MNDRLLRYGSGHRAVCQILLLTLTLSSVCPGVSAASPQVRAAAARSDGESLFRAIFFLDGPLADDIPELKRLKSMAAFQQLKPQQEGAKRAFQARLMKELAESRPNFFDAFGRAIQSGDRARISRALSDASQASKAVLRKQDPGVSRFLDRYEATLTREFRSAARKDASSGPPDVKALQRAVPKAAAQDAARLELTWLKGFKAGGPSSADEPDTDHSIAVVLLTFIAVIVIVVVALPITSATSGDLYHDKLVDGLATRAGTGAGAR